MASARVAIGAAVLGLLSLQGCSLVAPSECAITGQGCPGSGGSLAAGGAGGCGVDGPPQNYADTVRADCPVAYWRFGETCSGADCVAVNEVGPMHQGTYRAGYTLAEPGALPNDANTAVTLSHNGEGHVDVEPTIAFVDGAPFSLEIWAKPSPELLSNCDVRGLFSQEGNDDPCGDNFLFPGYKLYFTLNCEFIFRMRQCNGPEWDIISSAVTESRWYHVVATFDGATIHLYVDGVPEGNVPSGQTPILGGETFPFTIGGRSGGAWGQFDGSLDEAAVYDYALSQEQISAHFTAADGVMP